MGITVKGTEDLGQITPNGADTTLTIPAGTTSITFAIASSEDDVSGQVGAVTLGNLTVALSQETDLGTSTGSAVYHILDISGRADDVLRLSGAYSVPATWGAVYWSASSPAYDAADGWYAGCATCNGGPSVLSHAVTRPIGSIAGSFLAVQAIGVYSDGWSALNGSTELFHTADGGDGQYGSYKLLGATETMGWSGGGYWSVANGAVFYDASPDITPDPWGMGLGFNVGVATVGADRVVPGARMRALEVGFREGAIEADGPMQVVLHGEEEESVGMTEDGAEGGILTRHVNRKPTWEPNAGGGTEAGRWVPMTIDPAASGAWQLLFTDGGDVTMVRVVDENIWDANGDLVSTGAGGLGDTGLGAEGLGE